jgi:phosphoribosylamine--glycine ligase
MRVGVLGSGGREHALQWKLQRGLPAEDVFVLPGNGGTTNNVAVDLSDFGAVEQCCHDLGIDTLVVGPEEPLANGIADHFAGTSVRVFGPDRAGARLEASKLWAKAFMDRHGVATARWWACGAPSDAEEAIAALDGRAVVKYDGLAGGKGVFVTGTIEGTRRAVAQLADRYGQDAPFLVEERLEGQELSILGFTDGESVLLLPPSQDHKALLDGDRGPNTGGMGAFTPVPAVSQGLLQAIRAEIIEPTLAGLRAEGIAYRGVLYFGIMVTRQGPKLLEYNVRLGDPEAEVLLPALADNLSEIIDACLEGRLGAVTPHFHPGYYVDVVLASGGYPGPYRKGVPILGLDHLDPETLVFHAGTERTADGVMTAGGRVLNVVVRGETLPEAIEKAYREVGRIRFAGQVCRKDIGKRVWTL